MEKDKLEELAEPIITYLKENCHPYTSIVITEERVAVFETVLSIPKNYIRKGLKHINFVPEDSNGKHMETLKGEHCSGSNQKCFP